MQVTRREFSTAIVMVGLGVAVGFNLISDAANISPDVVASAGIVVSYLLGTINFLNN